MNRRSTAVALGRRNREILEAIVRMNIETGRAVSSGLVERYMQRAVSSATIRTVMQQLESDGYLEQPHTSAGRLPTDRGFRVFVDGLRAGWALRRHEAPAEMHSLVQRDIGETLGTQDQLKRLAMLLSKMTDNVSIIVGPSHDSVRVEQVEYYPKARSRGLLVVILDTSQVRTGLVRIPSNTPQQVVRDAVQLLNDRMSGRTLAQIRDEVMGTLDLVHTPVTACAGQLSREGQSLLTEPSENVVEVEGVANVFDAPELQEPQPLRALLRMMESPRALGESLHRMVEKPGHEFGVWIGHENPVGELRAFSILTGQFQWEGRTGTLAVLGPRRMSYERAFHGIDILREALDQRPDAVVG
ncbi:MAG: heat-inducible transcriptional repressor [Candidatus Krumholzibacteriia bacterium]|jgi:heat-inducible transcriptional repressor